MRITRSVGKRRTRADDELEEFGRFSEPALLILISLADGPKHGYAMTVDIASIADVQLGPGTLYGAIARLESRGLIEAIRAEDRRNPYRLTGLGQKALTLRLTTLETVARAGRRRLAASEG
jgi:DNA-binding PadR family transcriptional regulator